MKLFIYDHCPLCVKARMIFGSKNLPVEQVVMLNDEEATRKKRVRRKLAPILLKAGGSCMAESLIIVNYVNNRDGEALLMGKINPAITDSLAAF